MAKHGGRLLVGQSGGPTAVINSTLCGVVQEAMRRSEITGVLGMVHGIHGLLREEMVDAFGHKQLGGVADYLCNLVTSKLGLKSRFDRPGTIQRSFAACASTTDVEEAYMVGATAVQKALEGHTDEMVTLEREDGPEYRFHTGLAKLSEVSNLERVMPDEYINDEGNGVTEAFYRYAMPLIGEPLPRYARLARRGL